jgi:hypothetical protein
VNAEPILVRVVRAFADVRLEGVLIGNAGAALQGAPVTTEDFDFLVRLTPANQRKIAKLAIRLDAVASRPFYPASHMVRLLGPDGLQVDLVPVAHAMRSFASVRSRAVQLDLGGRPLLVADLEDILKSKRAAGRPKDRAVLEVLEVTLREKKKTKAHAR